MKFGSRMDIFLPLDATVQTKVGDKVVAGVTILAVLPDVRADGRGEQARAALVP
jgi:hypothetical protein